MKYIGNSPGLSVLGSHPRFDYVASSDPTVSTNPAYLLMNYLNSSSGEVFHCTDNTPGANVWVGLFGTTVE